MAKASIIKRLCLPVGQWQPQDSDKPKIEYRDIGVVLEIEGRDGQKWKEIKLHADVLNPVLFQMAKSQMERGSSSCRVKMFDAGPRKEKTGTGGSDGGDGQASGSAEDDDIPF